MKVNPRYDAPIATIAGEPGCHLEPLARQRRRLHALLAGLSDDDWGHPSRCDAWAIRDVVAHLVTVGEFWNVSATSALAGEPTRWLTGFDPAATPPQLVAALSDLSTDDLLTRLIAADEALIATLSAMTPTEWSTKAETPAGHVPIQLLAQHALWDAWIHERDIALPLGLEPLHEADEIAGSLQFAAAVSPVLALVVGHDTPTTDTLTVDASDPHVAFRIDIGDVVTVSVQSSDDTAPCLRGDAVELTEALTLRVPMPPSAPPEWLDLLTGLQAAFDIA